MSTHGSIAAGSSSASPRVRVDDLDDLDRRLVALLQADGRASYADLGEAVGLSPAGARLRVLRLQERGVLQIVAVTDPLALGYGQMAQIGIVVDSDVRAVADAMAAIDEVIYVVLTAGSFDLMVEVVATDSDALLVIVNDRIRPVPGVARAETFPYYGIHTHRFTWGVR
ncbi:MAG TPA: Lrp/AsnC ligand binding domain-containing protein [Candidatus Nanopelagicales bacterium]|nr:Lrp/AsnC ligand binding domain-containing protein [Candidatus Nanopelagicales bacterium]